MPEGQYTGQRQSYIYESDAGEAYILLLDATLAGLAGTGLVAATAANAAGASPTPKRFRPRGVYWQGTLDGRVVRKRIICGTTESTLYQSDVSQSLTIDGVAGSTTGRTGEQLTFVRLGGAATPQT